MHVSGSRIEDHRYVHHTHMHQSQGSRNIINASYTHVSGSCILLLESPCSFVRPFVRSFDVVVGFSHFISYEWDEARGCFPQTNDTRDLQTSCAHCCRRCCKSAICSIIWVHSLWNYRYLIFFLFYFGIQLCNVGPRHCCYHHYSLQRIYDKQP